MDIDFLPFFLFFFSLTEKHSSGISRHRVGNTTAVEVSMEVLLYWLLEAFLVTIPPICFWFSCTLLVA